MTTIRLGAAETPFDVDAFSQQLGEDHLRVTVPAPALGEVLKRIFDFMGFGVYVYAVVVIPSPTPTLDTYVVQLDRINFSKAKNVWVPFQEDKTPPSGGTPTG